ncbi:MAG: class I SAM-dependent methyltransferase [Rhodospirillales bacterium]|nr:class I SAM-dependent methyltransferase [Rhodospirillales bacterium]
MGHTSFDNFARLARSDLSNTTRAGRLSKQAATVADIVEDIAAKLTLESSDCLLEIGCGPGDLLLALSSRIASATGNDHPDVLANLEKRVTNGRIDTIAGNFMECAPNGTFSKILIYSVIQYLKDQAEVVAFIDKALGLLKPDGILLIGDIPNRDRKRRFMESETGRQFHKAWLLDSGDEADPFDGLPVDTDLVAIDDAFTMSLLLSLRQKGYESYAVPQPLELPFSRTREDIVIRGLRG